MVTFSKSLLDFIVKTYSHNSEEGYDTVEETVVVNKEVNEPNPIPGIICIACGPITFLLGVMEVLPFEISLGVSIALSIVGFILKSRLTKKVTKQIPEKKMKQVPRNKTRREKIVRAGRVNLKISIQNLQNKTVIVGQHYVPGDHSSIPIARDINKLIKEYKSIKNELEKIPEIMFGIQSINKSRASTIYGDYVPLRGLENRVCRYFENLHDDLKNLSDIKLTLKQFDSPEIFKLFKPLSYTSDSKVNPQSFVLEEFLNNWISFMPQQIEKLNKIRDSYVKDKLPQLLTCLSLKGPGAFNFYCPECNRKNVEQRLNRDYSVQNTTQERPKPYSKNTKCVYNPEDNSWICPVCTNHHQFPIPTHRVKDEILELVEEKLFLEHKVEREKKISETRLKELDYRKELKQKIDDINFGTYNQVLELEEELEEIKVEITGQKEAIEYLNNLAIKFQNITSDLIRSIQAETSNSVQRIQTEQNKVAELIEKQTNRDLEAYSKRMNSLSIAKRLDDEKREAISLATLQKMSNIHNQQKKQFALDAMVAREIYGIDPYKRDSFSNKTKLEQEIDRTN